jgi:hypothetical protein
MVEEYLRKGFGVLNIICIDRLSTASPNAEAP